MGLRLDHPYAFQPPKGEKAADEEECKNYGEKNQEHKGSAIRRLGIIALIWRRKARPVCWNRR
jgi:hypothetical protein